MNSKRWMALTVLLFACAAISQNVPLQARVVEHFEVATQPRLAALAKLGALMKTSLLVEGADMDFLQEPITVALSQQTVTQTIEAVLSGKEQYTVRQAGALLIVYPRKPARPLNRILKLPLGPIAYSEKSLDGIDTLMGYSIRKATGCNPRGFGYAGPALDVDIPTMSLKAATFERVVEQVAKAPVPSMWVVTPDTRSHGCIQDPGSMWEVGLYNDGCQLTVFSQSMGSEIVRWSRRDPAFECAIPKN